MQFCQNHWGILRKAIIDRGMEHLIAKTGEECIKKLVTDIDQHSKTTFDPLMGAHNMIISQALNDCGLEVMMQNEDGSDRCPICWMDTKHKDNCTDPNCIWTYEENWIQGVANDALTEAKRLGLINLA
jgi:hypothetical protein